MKKHVWKITFLGILIIANANPLYAQPEPEYEFGYPLRSQYPGEASKLCGKVLPLLPDGHKYTTFLIARYAGINEVDAYTLTYYSQYPDIDTRYEATPVALKSVLFPWRWRWWSDIAGVLHSLHGGKRDAVLARRETLGNLISKSLDSNSRYYWQAGLMIHSLGDAYSHTNEEYGSRKQKAHGRVIGHALHLHQPDQIARPDVFPKYAAYVNHLFEILSTHGEGDKNDGRARVDKYLAELKGLVCKPKAACSKKRTNAMSSRVNSIARDHRSFSEWRYNCIDNIARPLTKTQVQAVINTIQYGLQ